MADAPLGNTPENRRESDPFSPMTAAYSAPIRAEGHCDDDPHPQITDKQSLSQGPGQWAGPRPVRAAANNRRYACADDRAFGQINGPQGTNRGLPDEYPGGYAPTPCG